jgi:hypothetical protein
MPHPLPTAEEMDAYRRAKDAMGFYCPECDGLMELVPASEGVINEPCVMSNMQTVRVSRPASFLACTACEHCEEVRR